MSWTYKREENDTFEPIPVGQYRIRVASAEKTVSKNSGREMISLKFDVSGQKSSLFHHIVFMEDRPEITNRMLTQFFDSFPTIQPGDIELEHWIGKVGACTVKHEEYNGNMSAKVSYFIKAEKQESLPPWQEPSKSAPNTNANNEGWMTASTADASVPFNF